MKNILITGVNGFVGQNCLEYFSQFANVFGIDIAGDKKSNIIIEELNFENLKSFNINFDIIIHLAGSGTVGAVQQNPELEKKKSVDSCKLILEYIKNHNKNARLIFSSSASVYGNDYNFPIKEDYKLNPMSLYGEYKLEAEKICEEYANKYDLDIKIIRFFSLYGIGCKKQLLFDVLNRIKNLKEKTLPCFGTGEEIRDYINIKDAVCFINKVSTLNKKFEIFNCGNGKAIKVKEVIDLLIKYYDKDVFPEYDNIIREGNPNMLLADITKLKSTGFSSKIDFEKGINEYVEWFKSL